MSVLGVFSLRRCLGRAGVSNSTNPRFSQVFCGSSIMSESCKLAVDAVSEEFVLRVLCESLWLRVMVELLAEPPPEPTCSSGEDVSEIRLTVRDDNCSSELASEFRDSEKLSRLEVPGISLSVFFGGGVARGAGVTMNCPFISRNSLLLRPRSHATISLKTGLQGTGRAHVGNVVQYFKDSPKWQPQGRPSTGGYH